MVLIQTDLKLCKSLHSAGGISSLGGPRTESIVTDSALNLWDNISDSELSSSVVGEYEVRCIYVTNFSPTSEVIEQCAVWIDQNTISPYTDIDIGVGTAAAGDEEQTVANENTLPANILWSFARGEENALLLGNIAIGQGKSLWIRRHAGPARSGSSTESDNYILGFKFRRTGATTQPPPSGPGPPPSQGNDQFGVHMIYATNPSTSVSQPFFLSMANPVSDCRFVASEGLASVGSGVFSAGARSRLRLFTSGGSCPRDIFNITADTFDHDTWSERGYMYQANDWKNVEITGYFKIVGVASTTADRKLYMYSRTWRHNTGIGGGCSGTAYKGVVYGATGELKFHKEIFHDGSQPCGDRNVELVPNVAIRRTDDNTWFGMKQIIWNYVPQSNPNAIHVHMELWLDLDASNTWVKYAERNDEGGWYPGMPSPDCPGDAHCGGNQDQVMMWGGPITEIRWDGDYTNVHFKWLSCREIIPASTTAPPPPSSNPGVDAFGIKNIYFTEIGSTGWGSTTWNNGHNRAFGNAAGETTCVNDPDDNRFAVNGGNEDMHILGNGIFQSGPLPEYPDGGSPRVRVTGAWRNVESSVYIRFPTGLYGGFVDIRAKTDHYCTDNQQNGFGGYFARILYDEQAVHVRKEKAHSVGYGPRINEVPVTLIADKWYGFKCVCYNLPDGNVKVEAWMDTTEGVNGGNWIKITEGTDSGSWLGGPDTGECKGSGMRIDIQQENGRLDSKWWSIRKIAPP